MKKITFYLVVIATIVSTSAFADRHHRDHNNSRNCRIVLNAIGGYSGLETALKGAVLPLPDSKMENGGLGTNMWATVVSDDGTVCAVTKTGEDINDQWLGSRIISAQKANTANAFSLQNGLALSTANLWAATQPGGSLFGLQFSNPVDTENAYRGNSNKFGTAQDPLRGKKIGGVNVFGGGLALYDADGNMIGGLGVSGNTSCADHNIAWRTRDALGLDNVPKGLSGSTADNIIYDVDTATGKSAGGFGHPTCGFNEVTANEQIVMDYPIGSNP